MAAHISIIIPSRDRIPILQKSLTFLDRALQHIDAEVIVVNDGDSDLSALKKSFPFISVIDNTGNGVASARNAGAALATAEVLMFMDDDMWITREALQCMIDFHLQHDKAALNVNWVYPDELQQHLKKTAFGRYLQFYGFTTLKGWNKDAKEWSDLQPFETHGITSQNLSLKTSVFRSVGGYNESFPHAGFEDHDFTRRLHAKGIRIFIEPNIITYHNEADRVSVNPWMERRIRGAATRRVAVALGYGELSLRYSLPKKAVLSSVVFLAPLLKRTFSHSFFNRYSVFDFFSFFIFNVLLAAAIYEGYSTKGKERMLSSKTRFLNAFRRLFTNAVSERLLIALTKGRSSDSIFARLVPMPYLYPQPSWRRVSRGNVSLQLDISDLVDWHVYFGFEEKGYEFLFNEIQPSSHILDVGANIGYVALQCAQRAKKGKVYAFEPSSFTFKKCAQNIALNKSSNVQIFNCGLGSEESILSMEVRDLNNRGMNRMVNENNNGVSNIDKVRVTTVDQWTQENKIEKLDLIKIDVEGFEMEVLKGALITLLKHKPKLFLEIDDDYLKTYGSSAMEVITWLSNKKYAIYDMDGRRLEVASLPEHCHIDVFAKSEEAVN